MRARHAARDLAHLAQLGWRCERLEPWDLMPLTDQVECLAVLRRPPPPALAVLYEDRALVAVAKPPFLPTVPHPEHPDSLLARVRALLGRGDVVPLDGISLKVDAGLQGRTKEAEVVSQLDKICRL